MKFEKGKRSDIDEIARLYDDLNDYLNRHTNYPGWRKGLYPERETAAAGVESGTLHIVRQDGRIAGTVILSHEPEPGYSKADWRTNSDYQDMFVVHTLAVHPLFLKQGMGKMLMDFVIEYCKEAGAKEIRLDVYEKNTPAIGLYKKCGFQYIDTVDLGLSEFGLDRFELYQKILSPEECDDTSN